MKSIITVGLVSSLALMAALSAAADPVDRASRPDVLCIYYPEWHVYPEGDAILGKGRTEWENVKENPTRFPGHDSPIVPLDGYLDDSKPADVAKEIDYAADAGIDVFLYDWYWADHHPIEHEALEQGYMHAPNRDRIRFALMWAYHHRDSAPARPTIAALAEAARAKPRQYHWKVSFTVEEWQEAIRYCIDRYFRHPNYYRKDGKLFFSMYNGTWFVKNNGGVEGVRRLFAWAQDEVRKAGLPPIHFSAMVDASAADGTGALELVTKAGFASASVYSIGTDPYRHVAKKPVRPEYAPYVSKDRNAPCVVPYEDLMEEHRNVNRALAARTTIPFIPLASRGWDSSFRCSPSEPFPWTKVTYPYLGIVAGTTPDLFAAHVRESIEIGARCPHPSGQLLINAWNEYTEGSWLLPDRRNGTGYLQALKSVIGPQRMWIVDPFGWSVEPSGDLKALGGANGFAEARVARAAEGTFSVKVRPERRDDPDAFSSLSLVLLDDNWNFWRMALCQAPDAKGWRYFELEEMRGWQWHSATRDKLVREHEEVHGGWRWGEEYELALTFDPKGLEGTVRDAAGKLLFRRRFSYGDRPHVGEGGAAVMSCGACYGTFRELKTDIRRAADERRKSVPYASEAFVSGVTGERTGFFHVERKPDGRWWVIDPLGRGTQFFGVEHISYDGMPCEALGNRHAYRENNERKYSSPADWEKATLGRLKDWGFTALGAGSVRGLRHRGLAHTEFLTMGDDLCMIARRPDLAIHANPNKTPGSAFPNVFHPKFPDWCDYVAGRKCALYRDDPWLFGYYIDNELRWSGRGDRGSATGLFDSVAALPTNHTARIALAKFLAERASGVAPEKADAAVKRDFLRLVAEKYFSIASAAIRRHDPNHLVLGCRFAGIDNADRVVWEECGRFCDVVTFNLYPHVDLKRGVVLDRFTRTRLASDDLARRFAQAKKPMIVTEWSFPALDSGLPCTCGAGQRFFTQDERAAAAETFVKLLRATPFVVGHSYFMWVDDPPLGIRKLFGEDSNYGLVNERDEPYQKLTDVFRRCQSLSPGGDGVSFVRETDKVQDDIYVISNRVGLVLRGRMQSGNLFGDVRLDGVSVGRSTLLLAFNTVRGQTWKPIDRVTRVEFRKVSDGAGCLRIAAEGARDGQSFSLVAEVTVEPDRRDFRVELVELTNTGTVPLDVASFSFCNYVHGKAVRMQKCRGVPFLASGLAFDAFRKADGDAWMGTLSWAPGVRYFLFNVDDRGGQGANAFFNLPGATHIDEEHDMVRLQPSETYRGEGRVWAMALPGRGGDDAWAATMRPYLSREVGGGDENEK